MDVTSPPLLQKASRLDAAEADRIAAAYKVRTFPLPPGDLLGDEVFEIDEQGVERHDEAAKRVVAPHWNAAVDLLGDGAEGYLALLRLRDRLAGRVAEFVREADQGSIRAEITSSVRQILSHEAKRYRPDLTIGDALAGATPPADNAGWWWEPRLSYRQQQFPVAGAPPAIVALRSTYLDGLVSTYEWEFKDTLVEFEREWKWSRALQRATANEAQAERAMRDRDDRVHELAEFRLRVVEQVLREQELLGYVTEFDVGEVRHVALDDEQAEFVRAALAAIRSVEANSAKGKAPAATWDAVQKQITATDSTWGSHRIERVATTLGAFERLRGSARPTNNQIRDRYERFRERIVALTASAGAEESDESA